MVRWGKRCRRLRRRNNTMLSELTVLRTVVGQDHQLVQQHRKNEVEMARGHELLLKNSSESLESWGSRAVAAETRLERVPRWVRRLFKAV